MTGYEKVANFMTEHDEMAMFKRFKFLNQMDLLHRQAELEHLERQIKGYMKAGFLPEESDSDDESSDGEVECNSLESALSRNTSSASDGEITAVNSPTSSESMEGRASRATTSQETPPGSETAQGIQMQSLPPMPTHSTQPPQQSFAAVDWYALANEHEYEDAWKTMRKARQKLREYNEILLIQKELHTSPSPHKHDLSFFRTWLESKTMGHRPIWGVDGDIWNTSPPSELIAISPSKSEDPLASLVLKFTSTWWHECVGRRVKKPVDVEMHYLEYKNDRILRVANGLSSILSSLLLVVSILVLHFVTNMLVRLGVIAIFTTMFSFALILVTNARKVEVFAGTTAFAAVQVVFVGSTSAMAAN